MIRTLSLLVLILTALPAFAAPKNVVLLVADDLGMQVGCYGDKAAKTPNIDKLAASGTRFSHGFASVSSCSPSRATLLTGMPTHMCGQYGLAHAEHNAYSFRKVKGLPALLAPASRQSAANLTLVFENIQMPPDHLLHVVVALHQLPAPWAAFALPKVLRLADPQSNNPILASKFTLLNLPVQPKS